MIIKPNIHQTCLDSTQTLVSLTMGKSGTFPWENPPPPGQDKPWLTMPVQGRIVNQIGSLTMGSLTPNLDTVVTEYTVPAGFDLALTLISNQYTGAGFVEGSGDIIWRIRLGTRGRYAREFGRILTSLGSADLPYSVNRASIIVRENVTVQYIVNAAVILGAADRIICGLGGWIYPQQPYSM